MPTLSEAEIHAVERYVEQHRDQVLQKDRWIRQRNAAHKNAPHVEEILRQAHQERLARMASLRRPNPEGDNGDGHPG